MSDARETAEAIAAPNSDHYAEARRIIDRGETAFQKSVGSDIVRFNPAAFSSFQNEIALALASRDAVIAEQAERINDLEKLVYVPGLWRCAKCNCTVVSTSLYVESGNFAANNEPQQCPNDCGPMWRVTERQAGNDVIDVQDTLAQRATAAESRIADLEAKLAERTRERDAALTARDIALADKETALQERNKMEMGRDESDA
jgi:rubrerythrin